jgi:biotin carboxyl carrier protein
MDGTPPLAPTAPTRSADIATSPAVGYFAPRPEVAVGARVTQGDVLGWIDVLGVRQEVVAPVDGLVGKLLVGPGDPVEYGEELIQLVAAAAKPERPAQEGMSA